MASALDTSVKNLHNMMGGAPQINNTRGRLVEFLDAVLVDGFGEKNIASASYAPGLMTYSIPGHEFYEWQVVTVTGMGDPELNGEFRVVTTGTGVVTVAVTGVTAAPGSTAGAKIKTSPLGYERQFSVGGKRVYRSKNPLSQKPCLVVHDVAMTGYTRPSLWAAVGVTRQASGVEPEDFMGSQMPVDSTYPKMNWRPNVEPSRIGWFKWYYAMYSTENIATRAGNNQWKVMGDDRLFFLELEYTPSRIWNGRTRYTFGEIVANNPADNSAVILTAEEAIGGTNPPLSHPGERLSFGSMQNWVVSSTGWRMLASHDQIVENVKCWLSFTTFNSGSAYGGENAFLGWPNPATGETLMVPVNVVSLPGGLRGTLPGAYYVPHHRDNFNDGQIVRSLDPLGQGRRFLLTKTQYTSTTEGTLTAFDITGPWR